MPPKKAKVDESAAKPGPSQDLVTASAVASLAPVANTNATTVASAITTNTDGNVYGWMVTPLNLPRTLTFPYP